MLYTSNCHYDNITSIDGRQLSRPTIPTTDIYTHRNTIDITYYTLVMTLHITCMYTSCKYYYTYETITTVDTEGGRLNIFIIITYNEEWMTAKIYLPR